VRVFGCDMRAPCAQVGGKRPTLGGPTVGSFPIWLAALPPQGSIMGRAHILVVEDAFVVARRLQLSLERAGFSVETARNGREALQKSQRRQYDLVITDERMPLMSGRELCQALRTDPRYAATPMIFLTANPAELDIDELQGELSVAAVLEKPFRPEAVLHLIETELLEARVK